MHFLKNTKKTVVMNHNVDLNYLNIFHPETPGHGRKLDVYKKFKRRPGRLLNVLCTFNLRPLSRGNIAKLSLIIPKLNLPRWIFLNYP